MQDEPGADTLIGPPARLRSCVHSEACLVHIYPTGPEMGRRYSLGVDSLVIGRGDDADIGVVDKSASRQHARVEPVTDGYLVTDLGSRNGTYVNAERIEHPRVLGDGDYLSVGNCIFRFLTGGNVEAEYHEEIYRLTIIDGLTRVHNKRYLMEFLDRELARSIRHRRPLSVLMFDLDRFKAINDGYGHHCGDIVLRDLSERLNRGIRREDLFARYGGEEFALVLVETPNDAAVEVAQRLRQAVCADPFCVDGETLHITLSVGVSSTYGEAPLSPDDLIKQADANLYTAKRTGRNRVIG